MTNTAPLRPCRFIFDLCGDRVFHGFAVGTTWNGFDNVKVCPDVALAIDDFFAATRDDLSVSLIPPDKDGLIDMSNGWTTVII